MERMCRYALRPPLAQDRLHVTGEGEIWLTLRHRWADGTTHLRFDPLELLERLAVLTPRPRVNLILYYGVLAPRAAWRAAVVPATTTDGADAPMAELSVEAEDDASCATPSRAGTGTAAATRRDGGSVPGRSRIRRGVVRASRPAKRGVGTTRRSRSPTFISLGYSRLFRDDRPVIRPYPRCRGGGAENGRMLTPRRPSNISYRRPRSASTAIFADSTRSSREAGRRCRRRSA